MNVFKAIETRYKGYRFRSRLEARWAVFFDTLGLPWEYEKQGFDFGGGLRYLPDFWLPTINAWFEVKGEAISDEDEEKVKALRNNSTAVIVATGSIGDETLLVYCHDTCDSGGGQSEWPGAWHACPGCGEAFVMYGDSRHRICGSDWETFRQGCECCLWNNHDALSRAYEASRSARFEHGESL